MATATRVIEFDSAHRVMKHESKCRNLHGHRYRIELTVVGDLDPLGRVIDFGEMKRLVGAWVDEQLDHGTLLNANDDDLIELCRQNGWKLYVMDCNPTAENIARDVFWAAASLLEPAGITVDRVRLFETPNCWSDYPDGR